jgi:hypothetical protein
LTVCKFYSALKQQSQVHPKKNNYIIKITFTMSELNVSQPPCASFWLRRLTAETRANQSENRLSFWTATWPFESCLDVHVERCGPRAQRRRRPSFASQPLHRQQTKTGVTVVNTEKANPSGAKTTHLPHIIHAVSNTFGSLAR